MISKEQAKKAMDISKGKKLSLEQAKKAMGISKGLKIKH